MSSTVASKRIATHPDLPLPVLLCPLRTARRIRLRVDERQQLLKLTHPRRMRANTALAWAATQSAWVEEQLRRALPPEPFEPGATIPLEGGEVLLRWHEGPRTPQLSDGVLASGGPPEGFSRRVELFLKGLALDRLSIETAELGAKAGVTASSVTVGDARTRWGSCSSGGSIRYSWRLILAPPEVRRFVVAHEVAHLKHLNHGTDFRRLERELFGGDTANAERLLRQWSPRLRRLGLSR